MTIDKQLQNTVNATLLQKKNAIVIFEGMSINNDNFYQTNTDLDSGSLGPQLKTVLAIQVNLESIGYALEPALIQQLSFISETALTDLYAWLMPFLQREIGAYQQFSPMYPNFPKQVIEAEHYELMLNALRHYKGDWFGVRILPNYTKVARLPLVTETKPQLLKLGQLENIQALFVALVNSNTSLSDSDKGHIGHLFNYFSTTGQIESILKNEITISQKETLALVSKLVLQDPSLNFSDVLSSQFKTPTDVLRFAVSLSDGDISLAESTKFKNISRSTRRVLLALLNNSFEQSSDNDQLLDNMYSYRESWLRLGEKIHAGEYLSKYPKAVAAFTTLRNVQKKVSFNGELDILFEKKDYQGLISAFSQRPGVFARNLNRLLQAIEGNERTPIAKPKKKIIKVKNFNHHRIVETVDLAPNNPFAQLKGKVGAVINTPELTPNNVIEAIQVSKTKIISTPLMDSEKAELIQKALEEFTKVANKISTPVLLQVHHHFKVQHEKTVRAFLPKGNLSKAFVTDTNIAPLHDLIALSIVDTCENTLIDRFKSLPSLGKTYIDPVLKSQHVPFAMRSASKALHTLSRGSRIPTEDTDITRFFIWWNESFKDENGIEQSIGRVDVDLSCTLLDVDFNYVTHCSWTNLRGDGMTHSGDITSAPQGACEFIDIDKTKVDPRVQYVVMTVNAYTSHKYCDLPECYAGWMNRNSPQSGEIFDPRTVANKIDLSSDNGSIIPMIIDLKNNVIIWADIALTGSFYNNSIENQLSPMSYLVKGIANLNKPTLYDLFSFHAKARGEITSDVKEADTIFSLNDGITPYDMDIIASEYMTDNKEEVKPKKKMK